MAIAKSVLGLQKALKVHTGDGDYEVDPSLDPQGYGDLLGRSRDQRVMESRAAADALPLEAGIDPAQDAYFKTVNRGAEDGAMGPAGFNRQWAGFLEAPRVLEDNNPGTRYRMNYSTMGNRAQTLAGLSIKRPDIHPMPETHEAFMARMAKKFGAR